MKLVSSCLLGVALSVTLLASGMAGAASLKIGGGGGLISTDNSSSGSGGLSIGVGRNDSLVDVQTGGSGSGSDGGGLLGGHPTATVGVGDEDQVIVDLFGGGENGIADVRGDLGLGGDGDDVRLTLFGEGGDSSDVALIVDLFGPSDGGGTGGGGNGSGGGNGGNGGDLDPTATGSVVAGAGAGQRCFAPDARQIAHLVGRSGGAVSLSGVSQLRVVPVKLCPASRAQVAAALAANRAVQALRASLAAVPQVTAALAPSHDVGDVLAVAKARSTLTLYVL